MTARADQHRRVVELANQLCEEGMAPSDVVKLLLTVAAANATEPGDTCDGVVLCREHFVRNAQTAYVQVARVEARQRENVQAEEELVRNGN